MTSAAAATDSTAAVAIPPVRLDRAQLTATVLGNGLEFFDFISYATFAVQIGTAFFPSHDPLVSLLLSLATFGVGFFTRPLGGLLIGAYGDRAGRRAALTLNIGLMSLGTLAIAVTPGYASIGIAAPLILVTARLLQGFALGGEVGPATALLLECAPPGAAARYTRWQGVSQMIALLVGGLLAVVLGQLLDHEQLNAWGWRVPFLLGLTLVPVGIYIRQRLPETASSSGPASGVLSGLWTHQRGTLLLGALAIMAPTISVYLGQYMTTYAISSLHLPAGVAAWGTAATALGGLLGTWLGGPLADRVGCRPVMVWTRIALILAYYPAFLLLERAPSAATLILVAFGLQLLASPGATAIIAMLTAAFPARRRSAGLSVCYAAAVTVFGGTSQFMVTWLIHASGDVVAPAYYAMAASVISVWAVLHLPEPDRSQSYAA